MPFLQLQREDNVTNIIEKVKSLSLLFSATSSIPKEVIIKNLDDTINILKNQNNQNIFSDTSLKDALKDLFSKAGKQQDADISKKLNELYNLLPEDWKKEISLPISTIEENSATNQTSKTENPSVKYVSRENLISIPNILQYFSSLQISVTGSFPTTIVTGFLSDEQTTNLSKLLNEALAYSHAIIFTGDQSYKTKLKETIEKMEKLGISFSNDFSQLLTELKNSLNSKNSELPDKLREFHQKCYTTDKKIELRFSSIREFLNIGFSKEDFFTKYDKFTLAIPVSKVTGFTMTDLGNLANPINITNPTSYLFGLSVEYSYPIYVFDTTLFAGLFGKVNLFDLKNGKLSFSPDFQNFGFYISNTPKNELGPFTWGAELGFTNTNRYSSKISTKPISNNYPFTLNTQGPSFSPYASIHGGGRIILPKVTTFNIFVKSELQKYFYSGQADLSLTFNETPFGIPPITLGGGLSYTLNSTESLFNFNNGFNNNTESFNPYFRVSIGLPSKPSNFDLLFKFNEGKFEGLQITIRFNF